MIAELSATNLLAGTTSLGSAKAELSLIDGRFELKQLTAAPLNGNLSASALFHPKKSGSLDWRASVKAKGLDFGVLARAIDPKSENGGMININLDVGAEGVPFGKMHLAAATGKLEFDFCPTNLKAGILDLWATNILVALLSKLDPKNESKINCVKWCKDAQKFRPAPRRI